MSTSICAMSIGPDIPQFHAWSRFCCATLRLRIRAATLTTRHACTQLTNDRGGSEEFTVHAQSHYRAKEILNE